MSLTTLPAELLHAVLSHLDISSLLTFSQTSSASHAHHLHALHTLDLAVFPKKVQSLITFLQHSDSADSFQTTEHQIAITLPQRLTRKTNPKAYRHSIIASQNQHLTTLIERYGKSLETLTFHAWDIRPAAAGALAEHCSRLRHLSLCFDHSASRDPCIPAGYFEEPTRASPLWNALAGLGSAQDEKLVLTSLVSLRLERAGCTCAQLRGILSSNAALKEMRLRKVRGVDKEFVSWLGSSANTNRSKLMKLSVEDCPSLELSRTEDYLWLGMLDGLTSLEISGCAQVDDKELRRTCESLRIRHIGGYWEEAGTANEMRSNPGVLEVDDTCL